MPGTLLGVALLPLTIAPLVMQPDIGQTMLLCFVWAGLCFAALLLAAAVPVVILEHRRVGTDPTLDALLGRPTLRTFSVAAPDDHGPALTGFRQRRQERRLIRIPARLRPARPRRASVVPWSTAPRPARIRRRPPNPAHRPRRWHS